MPTPSNRRPAARPTSSANRIQKVLEDANIKLASVATDVLGVSGRRMLRALIAGQDHAEALADLAQRRLRAKLPQLREALTGRVSDHHRFLLGLHREHVEQLERLIEQLTTRIAAHLDPPPGGGGGGDEVANTPAAWSAGRTQGSYLSAQYRQLSRRRSRKGAAAAVAQTLLVISYHLLKRGTSYQELGTSSGAFGT